MQPVLVAANLSTDLIPDKFMLNEEIVAIYLFNAGAANVYYNFEAECDNIKSYIAWIVPGQQLAVDIRGRVTGFSVAGSTISIGVLKRSTAPSNNL